MTGKYLRIVLAVIALQSVAVAATGHVKNEETQFPDLEFSDARFDVVLLSAINVIPQTPVFEPDQPLSRNALATWIALAKGLGEGGETPDTDALAQAAAEADLVTSLQGEASFAELSDAFFGEAVDLESPSETPTKAEAATYLAAHLETPTGDGTLLEQAGATPGPTGPIEQVDTKAQDDGSNAYFLTIGDATLPAYQHIRVANGPTDLLAWEGRNVRLSLIREIGDREFLIFVEANPLAAPAEASEPAPAEAEEPRHAMGLLFYGLLAAVVLLAALLFLRRRRA